MSLNQPSPEEAILIVALERKPEMAVPADFHLRLRASISQEPVRRIRKHVSFARAMAYLAAFCLAAVLAALTGLYPDAIKAPESMAFILELVILGQLMAVGLWLGMRRES